MSHDYSKKTRITSENPLATHSSESSKINANKPTVQYIQILE